MPRSGESVKVAAITFTYTVGRTLLYKLAVRSISCVLASVHRRRGWAARQPATLSSRLQTL
jgi:hypothetical protein